MIPTSLNKAFRNSLIAILGTVVMIPTTVLAQEKITWKLQSHLPSASSSYEDSVLRVKNQLAECTNGGLELKVYEAGSLFPAKEIFPAVKRGIVQMGTIAAAYLPETITTAGIASGLPFAFRDYWEAVYFFEHLGFEDLIREEIAEHGVYYSTDKIVSNELVVKKPINSLKDFKGFKLRSSGAAQRFLTAAGAAAAYLPGPELYPALATGVVDGAHWGAAQGASSMSLYEVAKYHVKPAIAIGGTDAFIVNQKSLDTLPEAMRRCVTSTLDKHFLSRANEYQFQDRVALAKVVKNQGVKINPLPPEVVTHLSQVAVKQWDQEGKKGPQAEKALSILKNFLGELGYID